MPRLPRNTTVNVSSCHACHVKRRWMSSCTTPATQSAAASQAPNPGPRAPPGTISATPATQNDGGCEFVPHLPRETTVDVELYHACHAKCRGVTGAKSGPKRARLPRKTTVNVSSCHACHVKRRWMSSCHTSETKVDVKLYHACHVKRRWMSSCTTPATQSAAASQAPNPGPRAPPGTISATPATQHDGECEFVPRLPRETTVDVELYHACHAKCRGVTGAKSGPKGATRYHKCHACHAKRRWM